jgi:hypothetical protein
MHSRTTTALQTTLHTLAKYLHNDPALIANASREMMDKVEVVLTELVRLGTRHSKNGMLLQFALSRKTQALVDEASSCFNDAVAKLNLGLAVTHIGFTLRIDENVTVLMRYYTIYYTILQYMLYMLQIQY